MILTSAEHSFFRQLEEEGARGVTFNPKVYVYFVSIQHAG
jgi:hypothetical protein